MRSVVVDLSNGETLTMLDAVVADDELVVELRVTLPVEDAELGAVQLDLESTDLVKLTARGIETGVKIVFDFDRQTILDLIDDDIPIYGLDGVPHVYVDDRFRQICSLLAARDQVYVLSVSLRDLLGNPEEPFTAEDWSRLLATGVALWQSTELEAVDAAWAHLVRTIA
jgi:hypothetical protein